MRASGICRLPCMRALASRRGKGKKAVRVWWRGESLSSVFTQTRLLRPECVSAGILMLTYMSTLRSKFRRFLFRPQNAYFANSLNTSHRPRSAQASLRKATPRPAFNGERREKAKENKCSGKSERRGYGQYEESCLELQELVASRNLLLAWGALEKIQREFALCSGGKSLSSLFTQTRLLQPECVSAGILMLTYMSTLRSKSRRFLFRPQNAHFANFLNTSHRPRSALASLRKATSRPAFDGERGKTKRQNQKPAYVCWWVSVTRELPD